MDKLWAPWRINYIKQKRKKKCIFCEAQKNGKKSYVLYKTKNSTAILNIFPYNNGHIMISPKRHVAELLELRKDEILDLFKTLNKAKILLDKVLKPHGFNIGINLGKSAGAGIARHLHIHIVPRWMADTNFMPVLYDTKIISQSLDELYKQLKYAKPKTD
jgi:ATP adenylyltransferase